MTLAWIFRFFVIASLAIGILGAFVDTVVPGLLPPALAEAYETFAGTEESSLLFVVVLILSLVVVIGGIVGTIGLLLFKRWSRGFSLWLSVLSVLIYPLLGPFVSSGWSAMLTEISLILWGAALAMAYFSELKERFEKRA